MTVLYMPVRIESVEQAEALPIGTIIECTGGVLVGVAPHRKVEPGEWFGGTGRRLSTELHIETSNDWACEWTALVPIEAEEETAPAPFSHRTRFVTPWEEVSDKP